MTRPEPWGIKVTAVEVKKNVDFMPQETLQRAMAKQAEAEREKRAKIISAEGELASSEKLKLASVHAHAERRRVATALPTDAQRNRYREKFDDHFPPLPMELIEPFLARNKSGSCAARKRCAQSLRNRKGREACEPALVGKVCPSRVFGS